MLYRAIRRRGGGVNERRSNYNPYYLRYLACYGVYRQQKEKIEERCYMDIQELKDAVLSGSPVEHNGVTYKCVSAIIYRNRGGRLVASAELTDKNNHSITIAEPRMVKEAKNAVN